MTLLTTIGNKLVHNFWFLPPDLHERQRFIGSKIQTGSTVLDVGGEQPILEDISELKLYHTINIAKDINQTPKHIKSFKKHMFYDGKNLPFDDNSFDVVVSIDVLEHVDPQERTELIREMLRVAKHTLVCSAPLGTQKHIEAEKQLLDSIKDQKEASFLEDHIQKGLPSPKVLEMWGKKFNGKLSYSGDFRWSNLLYKIQRSEVRISGLNHLYFFLKLFFYATCNLTLYHLLVNKKNHSDYTNRFYFEVNKIY